MVGSAAMSVVKPETTGHAPLLGRAFAALLGEVILWDARARVVFVSPGARSRLGLADIELSGRTCRELPLAELLQSALHEGVSAALATRTTLARDLGEHLSFRSLPLADGDGPPWGAVTWLRPVVHAEARPAGQGDLDVAAWEDAEDLVAAFRTHFELAEFSSSLFDRDGRFRAMNLVGGGTMGMVPEAVVGHRFEELFTAEVAAEYHRRTDEVLRSGRPMVRADHVVTAQREAWYLSVLVPLYNRHHRRIGVQAMSHDLTGLYREAERARLEAVIVDISRRLVGLAPAAIDAAVVAALRQVAGVLGADDAALLQPEADLRTIAPTHRWGAAAAATPTLSAAQASALAADMRAPLLFFPDLPLTVVPGALQPALVGGPRSLLFVPVHAADALLGALLLRWSAAPARPSQDGMAPLAVLADILLAVLRRKRAEEALQRSEATLRRAQALAHVGSYMFDLRSGTSHLSDETLHILALPPTFTGLGLEASIDRFVHPEDRELLRDEVTKMLAEGGVIERELRLLRADGAPRQAQIVSEIVRDAAGPTFVLGTVLDVTERRRLEAQLLHSQKMEAVGRLAGGVAHDFNNLLTVILGGTAALQLELPDGPLAELVAEIDDAGRRATALTRQLLAFSRRQVVTPVQLDLGGVVRDSLRVLARVIGEDIDLHLALAPEPLPVVADASQIEQVLLNLVVNAREAMPAGGRLAITTTLVRRAPRGSADADAVPWALLIVSDTGCGVEAQVKARMFEPFFTTKPRGQGSGLGLSTVHAVVDGLGGHVEVDSEVGQGTELRVFLPSRVATAPVPRAPPPRARELRGHETVLVVEDEDGVRNLVKRVLDEQGYHVLTARDAGEALHVCGEVAVDLVLTDLIMPGMSGRDLAARLRARRPVRVLFMSGYTDETGASRDADAQGLLLKPFSPVELAARVRQLLDRPIEP